MNILIIEDEIHAANHLQNLLSQIEPNANVLGWISSVSEVKNFMQDKHAIDLIFSDIEIRGGHVFSAFEIFPPKCPIIFTTAYNDYLLDAFQSNGIEYLLKPYDKDRLEQALKKFHRFHDHTPKTLDSSLLSLINQTLRSETKVYKTRFTIKRPKGMQLLDVKNVVLFKLDQTGLFAFDNQANYYPMHDFTLSSLEEQLDPNLFFRINRNEIINIQAISLIQSYGKDKLQISLEGISDYCLTSSHKTPEFRRWIESS
ncbi:response regulator transcription factor [Rheinheimera sp. YQF-2]|uniref:Response regulator transcription factor n=1 Tax=Rheinheimera lutimaris TaxID=2740584 RepID=A0A7Y5ATQ3_9GAMM|nr:LytTR family DNA-binding domain-containing protein [Rheinheimera lutimaris]NRQ44377.1 response regulator transcription factor [Rheinheimera lutimaris]